MSIKLHRNGRETGATLVEVLIGLLLGVMLSVAVVSFTVYSGKSLAGLFNYVDMQYTSRQALDIMSRDVRQVAYLQSFSTNKLTLMDYDGKLLEFTYDPNKQTLVRTKDGQSKVLLRNCDGLNFSIYQRSPVSGTMTRPTTTNVGSAKVINVSWTCWRSILGRKVTTERIDAAKIIIRKN